jgi:hypothetical protein
MCTIRHYIRDFVFFSCLVFSFLSFLRNVALISIRDLLSVQFSGARMHNRVLGLGVTLLQRREESVGVGGEK